MNTQWNWSTKGTIASDMKAAHALIDQIMTQFQDTDWTDKERFAVNLALEEALVNAVQHGNNQDPQKIVLFLYQMTNDHIYVRIEDEGEGFDPDAVPDPTDEEHILIASGRGVLLIRSFASQVRWNERGNVIEFEKNRG